jgi:hypothetical protein
MSNNHYDSDFKELKDGALSFDKDSERERERERENFHSPKEKNLLLNSD